MHSKTIKTTTVDDKKNWGGGGGGALVFFPVHIGYVGPTSLQYRISFDVGMGEIQKALMWLQALPKPCLPVMP